MRKRFDLPLLFAAIAVFGPGIVAAQDEIPGKVRLYGFVRNDVLFDSREVDTDPEEPYFFMPGGTTLVGEVDQNAVPSLRMLALTSRLGVKVSGYQIGETKVTGTIEGDFFVSSGSTATFRMRQAYMGLLWDNLELGDLLMNVGQTWHPMAADMPHMNNLETGAPFNPFNRSPQVMADVKLNGHFSFTGGFLYLNHYLPVGPSGKSKDYYKYGLPEVYLGVTYKNGPFVGKAGLDMVNSKPYNLYDNRKAKGYLTTFSPFLFGQYTKGLFQLRAKTILAQSGEHMNLLSGYGVCDYESTSNTFSYTPMQDWASFVSVQYGKKVQFLGMAGYMKQLGTTKDLSGELWLNTAADAKITEALRFTPTVAWNIGKFTVSLEYNITTARFGEGVRDARGLFEDGKWITNHRFICMTKFNF